MINTDFLVIGGGSAGLTAAFTARGFNKKVILIEKDKIGGECTWNGCIPSKALINSAKIKNKIDNASDYGIEVEGEVKTKNVLDKVRRIQEEVYDHETPEALNESGIEVIIGEAEFISKNTVKVNDKEIKANKIIIATGSLPRPLNIDGSEEINYLTNETIFKLDSIPKSLGVIGSGPIGMELSQSFNRLGSKVKVFLRHDRILKKENNEISKFIKGKLEEEGIEFFDNFKTTKLSYDDEKNIVINNDIKVEKLLVAIGRIVNYNKLSLDKAGIELNDRGIILVNDKLQTTNNDVYCCGDVIGPFRLSHMAYEQGKLAAMNAILPINKKISYNNIIWSVFTEPEVSHLGIINKNDKRKKYYFDESFETNDRAITEKNNKGLVKVITDKNYKILEVNIVGPRAGEIIHHFQILKSLNIPLYKAESLIYAYPSYSEVLREIGKKARLHKINNNFFVNMYKKVKNE